jgi:hypothetical protein
MIDFLFWGVITLLVCGPLLNIAMIGRPREPIGPGAALANLILTAVVILVILARVMEA